MEIALEYSKKLQDPRWQQLRLRVFERDGWKCRLCEATNKPLHAHHSVYHPYIADPWDYSEATVVTLCNECHEDEHSELKVAHAVMLTAFAEAGVWDVWKFYCASDIVANIDWKRSTPDKVVMKGEA